MELQERFGYFHAEIQTLVPPNSKSLINHQHYGFCGPKRCVFISLTQSQSQPSLFYWPLGEWILLSCSFTTFAVSLNFGFFFCYGKVKIFNYLFFFIFLPLLFWKRQESNDYECFVMAMLFEDCESVNMILGQQL